MPVNFSLKGVLPLKVLCRQIVLVHEASEKDFEFIKKALTAESCPGFNGYNTREIRMSGKKAEPKTRVYYRSLIDKTPSDPSTVLTAMNDTERISNDAGQEATVLTSDQQLYRVMVDIVWSNPTRWQLFVPRIGGMHWIMNFVGCVGKLMEGSGLNKFMSSAFAGVEKMLIGKKFPMNVRALRQVTLELLKGHIDDKITSYSDFLTFFEYISSRNVLAEHWVKNLIKPVLLMMLYIRAERIGEFSLHLYACKEMIPYFFAAAHWNYARDSICYLRSMEKLPGIVLDKFLEGDHAMHHKKGIWNGIWSDMMIETTYMKYGKGPSGLIGITTNPRSVQIWSNSHHIVNETLRNLERFTQEERDDVITTHKEESRARIVGDAADRRKLRNFLVNCIHPFEAPENVLYNIYTGETCTEIANVTRSYEIGTEMMLEFNESLPEGFRSRLSNKVITMAKSKKPKKKDETNEVYNTELIFSRVMYLLNARQIELESIFHYKLAPVPTSMFEDNGEPRFIKSKSVLKNKLKVEVSQRNLNPDAVVIDGGGMLHSAVHWPKEGTVKDFTDGVCNYIIKMLEDSDVYLAFDRYIIDSIKAATRLQRIGNIKRSHNVSLETPLPPKEVALSSNKTKENLIELISNELLDRASTLNYRRKLIVTSKANFPEQSFEGERVTRYDMETTFDEADYIIPQQVVTAFRDGK